MGDAMEEIELPLPAIIKPVKLWTGKQLISLLIHPNKDVKIYVNLELCERSYKANGPLCENEGYIVFRNSELVCGSLAKKTLGSGSKSGLLYALMHVAGPKEASRCVHTSSGLTKEGGHHFCPPSVLIWLFCSVSSSLFRCMNRLSKLSARYLGGHLGFSVGIDDVVPSGRLTKLKDTLLAEGYENATKKIQLYSKGELPLKVMLLSPYHYYLCT